MSRASAPPAAQMGAGGRGGKASRVPCPGQAPEASTWPAGCRLFLPQRPVRPATARADGLGSERGLNGVRRVCRPIFCSVSAGASALASVLERPASSAGPGLGTAR